MFIIVSYVVMYFFLLFDFIVLLCGCESVGVVVCVVKNGMVLCFILCFICLFVCVWLLFVLFVVNC